MTSLSEFDMDEMERWAPELGEALRPLLPPDFESLIRAEQPEYLSDARAFLLNSAGRQEIIARTGDWLSERLVNLYHGSRLSDPEIASVRAHGLVRLDPDGRCAQLERILGQHPEWDRVKHRLPEMLAEFGDGHFGRRANQVHFAISRLCLLQGHNHYLVEGSEFDGHVGRMLLGPAGLELLKQGRSAVVVKATVPGQEAIAGANPFGMAAGVPNLLREILDLWAYRAAHPGYTPCEGEIDCALIFYRDIPADWISEIAKVEDAKLMPFYRSPYPP